MGETQADWWRAEGYSGRKSKERDPRKLIEHKQQINVYCLNKWTHHSGSQALYLHSVNTVLSMPEDADWL